MAGLMTNRVQVRRDSVLVKGGLQERGVKVPSEKLSQS